MISFLYSPQPLKLTCVDLSFVLNTLESITGLNNSTGRARMIVHLQLLSQVSPESVSIIDTRGLFFFYTLLCIGKTYWIHYTLRRRLGEKSVTLWCLFCSEGVLIIPAKFSFKKLNEPIWTLIDAPGLNHYPGFRML
jgi:hypothetical protein